MKGSVADCFVADDVSKILLSPETLLVTGKLGECLGPNIRESLKEILKFYEGLKDYI